ncbi:MAG TPA: SDR family NAD(P)-dependent oxidoreductase, partial [Candidatus Nitrosotenuis sp.]|nr:SDR family NAD(P)-dependent oxidoreductase [Candidatus Nitrosotenuis sp.]
MTKTVLITGAAQRIGRHIALDLAQHGYHVIIHYHTSDQQAQRLIESLKKLGVNAMAFSADLSHEDEVQKLIPTINQKFGAIDVLINNASTFAYDTIHTVSRES